MAQRMTLTGINSKGIVYMARRRTWVSDTFHVFDRVVTMGATLPDGSTADQNYVWLSDWQIENINSNYLLPIDLETYRKLRNQIAKILVPLLQVWLYASRAEGKFEKRYADLCEILDIAHHNHLSLIRRQLEPSLTELTYHGYLASWAIEPTADGREYKLVAVHGQKFYNDRKIRNSVPAAQIEGGEVSLLKELTNRGINEVQGRRLLRSLPAQQPIQDQLEYGDYLIWKSRQTIKNPPGFYVYLLRENILPPADFETSSLKKVREANQDKETEELSLRIQLENAYHEIAIRKFRLTSKPLESQPVVTGSRRKFGNYAVNGATSLLTLSKNWQPASWKMTSAKPCIYSAFKNSPTSLPRDPCSTDHIGSSSTRFRLGRGITTENTPIDEHSTAASEIYAAEPWVGAVRNTKNRLKTKFKRFLDTYGAK